jgi:hypothetical protein
VQFSLAVLACVSALPFSPYAADPDKEGATCDGIAHIEMKGLWCEHPAGQCQVIDGAGTCVKETSPSDCKEIPDPVCACATGDKPAVQYANDCLRKVAKARLDYKGACKK